MPMTAPGHTLLARLDSLGDVLLTGPAVRAVADRAREVTLLCGPRGRPAAELLPGVDRVLVWDAPWINPTPEPVDQAAVGWLVETLRQLAIDDALIFSSFHQSALPLALLLRLAGVPWTGAISTDYPGSLLDLRLPPAGDIPEAEAMLRLATTAGYRAVDGTELRVRAPLPDSPVGPPGYVAVHPGASVPAREWPPGHYAAAVRRLAAAGYRVVVTGSPAEADLTARVAGPDAVDLGGRTTFGELAAVLAGAAVLVAGNTGPAHLAAAVGTPVVSLHAPVVPAARWAPYGVPGVLLGDQQAACRDTRARECPVPGHPCLTSVTSDEVLVAVETLTAGRATATTSGPATGVVSCGS